VRAIAHISGGAFPAPGRQDRLKPVTRGPLRSNRFCKTPPKQPSFSLSNPFGDYDLRSWPKHRLDAILPDLGIDRAFPAILDDPQVGDSARLAL